MAYYCDNWVLSDRTLCNFSRTNIFEWSHVDESAKVKPSFAIRSTRTNNGCDKWLIRDVDSYAVSLFANRIASLAVP
jgi:hypothetical protein